MSEKEVKRIAVYTEMSPGGGGSFQYGASILSALSKLDKNIYEVHFWCSNEAWAPIVSKLKIKTTILPRPFNFFTRVCYRGAREILKICNSPWKHVTPSIYPVYLWKPHICISLDQRYIPLNNCKIICPVHDLMHRYEARFPEVGELSVYLDREINYSAQCNTAAAILVDSTVGKNHVCEIYGIDPKKVFILPFIPSPLASCAKKPDNFPLNDGVPFLFYPAQLWLHKNHVNLLKAVHSLSEYFHIDCVFTGTTDKNGLDIYNNTIKNLQLEQQVHHLGYVTDDEIRWLYEHARCMIMPSFFGPTNIPPLEAMQAGCPVAVSDIYAMRERYGDAALYFNPHKVSEIANTIKLLWMDSDLCSEMKKRGYQQAAAWTQQDFEQHFLEIFYFVEKN